MKKQFTLFIVSLLSAISYGQKEVIIPQETLNYINRAADGDHLALEGGHLALDGHVMPYPFFEAHETLYLYRLSQLRHKTIWQADSIFYKAGWEDSNLLKTSSNNQGKKVSVNTLNGGRHTHEAYWFEIPKLPKNTSSNERFFSLKPIEMTLPGWPETTIYVNGTSKAALMRQHFYWSTDQLFDETKANNICLKSFGIYDQPRGYKDVSVVERDKNTDELYWYMRVLIEAKSILNTDDKGYTEIKALTDEVISKLDLDLAKTTLFKEQLNTYLPSLKSKFKTIEALADSPFTLKMLNHGHLDSAWRWTLDHTDEKIERLVLNNLYLMDRYPEYKYIFTTPYHYERMQELYPELFKRVQEKIKTGQWIANGSTYVETDMNLPGNESIVRQFLYGLDYYRNTLGVTKNTLFLPDTFGYPRFLPQIAQGFGLDHLIAMRVNTPEIDHIVYRWKGIDNTEILVNGLSTPAWEYPFVNSVHNYNIRNPEHYTTYNAPDPGPRRLLGTWNQFRDKAITDNQIMLIGWGDGGGGGTEDQIELKRKASSLPSFPKVQWTNMYDYITEQKLKNDEFVQFDKRILPSRFVQRTFISANGLKKVNRAIEQRLRETEVLSVLATKYGFDYPKDELKRLWKIVLLHHFHDIITGMAVPEVISEAYETLIQVEKETTVLRDNALHYLLSRTNADSNTLVAFNPSGISMSGIIEFPNIKIKKGQDLVDNKEQPVAFTTHNKKVFVQLDDFKPMSFKTFHLKSKESTNSSPSKKLQASKNTLENELIRVTFNTKGEISSYFDKEVNRELVPKDRTWNNFIALKAKSDVTIKEFAFNSDAMVKISKPKADALKASLELTVSYKNSHIKQQIALEKGSKQLTLDTHIDWKESERLEVDFPLNFATNTANHGIQWGSNAVERSRYKASDSLKMPFCAHQWADVSDPDYGVSIFDNVRYGYDLKKGGIRLILSYGQRKQTYEELEKLEYSVEGAGDVGGDTFSYAIFPHKGVFNEANTIQKAKTFNTPLIVRAVSKNSSTLKLENIISGLPENIILQTIKEAEDGNGIIVRLYETEQRMTNAELIFSEDIKKVMENSLNENFINELKLNVNKTSIYFKPFEIKTLRIQYE